MEHNCEHEGEEEIEEKQVSLLEFLTDLDDRLKKLEDKVECLEKTVKCDSD